MLGGVWEASRWRSERIWKEVVGGVVQIGGLVVVVVVVVAVEGEGRKEVRVGEKRWVERDLGIVESFRRGISFGLCFMLG